MIDVSVSKTQGESGLQYVFEADGGALTAGYLPEMGRFVTGNLNVERERRGEGIAKALLNTALAEARTVGASSFFSLIISRECLDAEAAVFGDEATITIRELGTYTPDGEPERFDTRASLLLELK